MYENRPTGFVLLLPALMNKKVLETFPQLQNGGRELIAKAHLSDSSAVSYKTVEQLISAMQTAGMDEATIETVRTASTSPVGENGKPRMLKITAWMCHAGVPNRNGDMFLAEDLKEAVEKGLFAPPYFGMVDYNHDFIAYGAWYSTKYEYDPIAKQYGILAEGSMFAWRYSELADKMLAMQARQGFIEVSMACMPESVTYFTGNEDEPGYTILHKPCFFTTSLLDVQPADPHGRGLGTESTDQPSSERELLLQVASLETTKEAHNTQEAPMTLTELVEAFRKVVAEENQTQFDEIVAKAMKLAEVEGELADRVVALTQAVSDLQKAQEENKALREAAEEKDMALAEQRLAREAAEQALTEAATELATLREFKATADETARAADEKARREARLAELSDVALAALQAKEQDVQDRLVARWASMEDVEWEVIRDSLNVSRESMGRYESATTKEGVLAAGAVENTKTKYEIDRFISN